MNTTDHEAVGAHITAELERVAPGEFRRTGVKSHTCVLKADERVRVFACSPAGYAFDRRLARIEVSPQGLSYGDNLPGFAKRWHTDLGYNDASFEVEKVVARARALAEALKKFDAAKAEERRLHETKIATDKENARLRKLMFNEMMARLKANEITTDPICRGEALTVTLSNGLSVDIAVYPDCVAPIKVTFPAGGPRSVNDVMTFLSNLANVELPNFPS